MIDYADARRSPAGRRDRRRAARSGGRPRVCRATASHVDVVHAGAHLMNAQLGPAGRRDPAAQRRDSSASSVHTGSRTTAIWARTRSRGVRLRDRPDSRATWWWWPPASGRTSTSPLTSGFTVERAIVVDDQMRTVEDEPTSTRSASACSTAARSTAWSRRCGSRRWCWPTTSPAPNPSAAYLGSRTATKLKVAGVEVASMGLTEPERDTDEHIVFSEPKPGRLQVDRHPRRQDHRRHAARRQPRRSPSCSRRSTAGLPLPEERVELMFDLGGPSGGGRRRRARRRRPGLQLQRRQQGRTRATPSRRLQDRRRGDGQDPGRQGLRLLQGAGLQDRRAGPPAARSRRTRRRTTTCPASRWTSRR